MELLGADGWVRFPEKSYAIEASHAYFDERGRILLNHRGDQTIAFKLDPQVDVPKSESDVVAGLALRATFERLALSRDPACSDRLETRQ